MIGYLARRGLHAVLVLFIVTLVAFLLIHLVPGDPVRIMLGAHAPPSAVAQVRHQLGLDRSLASQFASFLEGLPRGNLGTSISLQRPVRDIIGPRIAPSIFLLVYGTVISLLVAVPLGVFSALYRNRPPDHTIRVVATVGLAMPSFWFGLLARRGVQPPLRPAYPSPATDPGSSATSRASPCPRSRSGSTWRR